MASIPRVVTFARAGSARTARPEALTLRSARHGSSTASRAGAGRECAGVLLQLGPVVERIDPVQLAGGDQAHEQIAHAGAVLGLVEQRVLAMQDRLLQRPLAHVVVQRRTR